jgi:hypothetical protein
LRSAGFGGLGSAGSALTDWLYWINSEARHLVSKNVMRSAVVGMSAREAVAISQSRDCSSNEASIK